MHRHGLVGAAILVAGSFACGPPARVGAERGTWVLIQVPKNSDTDAPVTRKRVATFASDEHCEAYRTNAMQLGEDVGSGGELDEASDLRCVRDDAPSAGSTGETRTR